METAQPCGERCYCPHSTDEKAELGGLGELAQGCSTLPPPFLLYPSQVALTYYRKGAREGCTAGSPYESGQVKGGRPLGRGVGET